MSHAHETTVAAADAGQRQPATSWATSSTTPASLRLRTLRAAELELRFKFRLAYDLAACHETPLEAD